MMMRRNAHRATLLELTERPLRRTVRAFHQEARCFRALVSYLARRGILTNESCCRMALLQADTAMEVCECRPLQAALFPELYVSAIVDATRFLLSIAGVEEDPVLRYIRDQIPQIVPAPLILSYDPSLDMLVSRWPEGVVMDPVDFERQLHGIVQAQFCMPMSERDSDALLNLRLFQQKSADRLPRSLPVEHDWSAAQRTIRNAVALEDFQNAYNSDLDIGNFPAHYRNQVGAFDDWAEQLVYDSEAQDMFVRIQTMRLFYFELYRRFQSHFFDLQDFRQRCGTWIHNGLVLCIKADRSYTLITRRMDWIRTGTNNQFGNQRLATVHPIYQWYINESPFFTQSQRSALDWLLHRAIPRDEYIADNAQEIYAVATPVDDVL